MSDQYFLAITGAANQENLFAELTTINLFEFKPRVTFQEIDFTMIGVNSEFVRICDDSRHYEVIIHE